MTTAREKERIEVVIPRNVSFSALRLTMHPGGEISVAQSPLEDVCSASGLPVEALTGGGDPMLLPAVLGAWLGCALEGGEVIEDQATAKQIIDAMTEAAWSASRYSPKATSIEVTLLAHTRLH